MALSRHFVDDNNPSSASTDMKRLLLQCRELEMRNEILNDENDELKQKLKYERSSFQDEIDTMQHGMDDMKKTTSELEDQVSVLLHLADTLGSGTLEEIANNDSDPGRKAKSEVELQRVLCRIWKKRYQELKDQVDNRNLLQEDKLHGSRDCVVQTTKPKTGMMNSKNSRRAPRGFSLKRLTRGRSMPPKRYEETHVFVHTSSSGTDSTDECTSKSNSSDTLSSIGSDPKPCERYMVSSMPWKSECFRTDGLYYGQIDLISRLPDGLGVFHYIGGDDNEKHFVRGEWMQGKLLPAKHEGNYDENGVLNKSDDDVSVIEL